MVRGHFFPKDGRSEMGVVTAVSSPKGGRVAQQHSTRLVKGMQFECRSLHDPLSFQGQCLLLNSDPVLSIKVSPISLRNC